MSEIDQSELDPITEICHKLYPNQLNVLQATSQTQYWLSGPDPLDFINIYINNQHNSLDNHFHYVSLGLTDIYGDERTHKKVSSLDLPSGFGYELTIRLRKNPNDKIAPKWPIKLMQALARYTFENGALLDTGDHIPNVINEPNSTLKHLLITEDPQLKTTQTKFGTVKFLQIVGCTDDELFNAQQWSARKVLALMKQCTELGKDLLITDLSRMSVFETYPNFKRSVEEQIINDGSDLSFVKSNCLWRTVPEIEDSKLDSFKPLDEVEVFLDHKSAKILSVVLKQRLKKNNAFIFNGLDGRNLILVPLNFKNDECYVNKHSPLKTNASQTQILLIDEAILQLEKFLSSLNLNEQEPCFLRKREKFALSRKNNSDTKSSNNQKITDSFLVINILPKEEIN